MVEHALRHVPELTANSRDAQDDFHVSPGPEFFSYAVGEKGGTDPAAC